MPAGSRGAPGFPSERQQPADADSRRATCRVEEAEEPEGKTPCSGCLEQQVGVEPAGAEKHQFALLSHIVRKIALKIENAPPQFTAHYLNKN